MSTLLNWFTSALSDSQNNPPPEENNNQSDYDIDSDTDSYSDSESDSDSNIEDDMNQNQEQTILNNLSANLEDMDIDDHQQTLNSNKQNIKLSSNNDNAVYKIHKHKKRNSKLWYYLEWLSDHSKSWVIEDDISDELIVVYNTIRKHNKSLRTKLSQQNQTINSKKAFVYARKSNTNDTSIENQLKHNSEYCFNNNISMEFCGIDNGVSGGLDKRTGKMNNLQNGDLGFWKDYLHQDSILVCHSVDRLGRSLADVTSLINELHHKGVEFYFIQEEIHYTKNSPYSISNNVNSIIQNAENFSKLTSQKIKASIAQRRKDGHHIGKARFGYKTKRINNIRKLVQNEQTYPTILKIKELYNKYKLQVIPRHSRNRGATFLTKTEMLHQIIHDINNTNMRFHNGKKFNKKIINDILVKENIH
tara:strand:+ start:608 stop:1861 length:1254 start_codon:yes stop_codon:yes gene_type:complete